MITLPLQSKRVLLAVTGSIAARDSQAAFLAAAVRSCEERAAAQRRRSNPHDCSNPHLNQET